MGKIKLSPIQQRENRRRFKASNKELNIHTASHYKSPR